MLILCDRLLNQHAIFYKSQVDKVTDSRKRQLVLLTTTRTSRFFSVTLIRNVNYTDVQFDPR